MLDMGIQEHVRSFCIFTSPTFSYLAEYRSWKEKGRSLHMQGAASSSI